jgi:hypothetical protein
MVRIGYMRTIEQLICRIIDGQLYSKAILSTANRPETRDQKLASSYLP